MYTLKEFSWNEEKNLFLMSERGLCFEDVLESFEKGEFYGVFKNSSSNFPEQSVFLVKIRGYPCIVPFIENEEEIFLKTIIPDRRYKKFIKEEL